MAASGSKFSLSLDRKAMEANVPSKKKYSKHISNTLLRLVYFFSEHTLGNIGIS